MELPLQLCVTQKKEFQGGVVSILVLMELPLQLIMMKLERVTTLSFNPCFNGTTSATISLLRIEGLMFLVSILVLMELPLQRKIGE